MPNLDASGLGHLGVVLRVKGDQGDRADNPMKVQGLQGAEGFKVTQGYAGLVEVPRPRRVSMVQYTGAPPIHMQGDIIFDTWTWVPEASVDGDFQMLEIMAGLSPKHTHPYILNIVGQGIPHEKFDWFLWDITWGEAIRNTEGQLKRQVASIELVEAVTPGYERKVEDIENVEQPSAGHGRFIPTSAKNKKFKGIWIVKKGDTLQYVSRQVYGEVKWWKRIANANKLANPKRLVPGTKLKIPRLHRSSDPFDVTETAGQSGT